MTDEQKSRSPQEQEPQKEVVLTSQEWRLLEALLQNSDSGVVNATAVQQKLDMSRYNFHDALTALKKKLEMLGFDVERELPEAERRTMLSPEKGQWRLRDNTLTVFMSLNDRMYLIRVSLERSPDLVEFLKYLESQSDDESYIQTIAEDMNVSTNAVKKRIESVREKIVQAVGELPGIDQQTKSKLEGLAMAFLSKKIVSCLNMPTLADQIEFTPDPSLAGATIQYQERNVDIFPAHVRLLKAIRAHTLRHKTFFVSNEELSRQSGVPLLELRSMLHKLRIKLNEGGIQRNDLLQQASIYNIDIPELSEVSIEDVAEYKCFITFNGKTVEIEGKNNVQLLHTMHEVYNNPQLRQWRRYITADEIDALFGHFGGKTARQFDYLREKLQSLGIGDEDMLAHQFGTLTSPAVFDELTLVPKPSKYAGKLKKVHQ